MAGIRWTIEESFQTGKSQVGLNHYQVRGWTAWHRYITLAMLALAVLMTAAAAAPPEPANPYQHVHQATPIALTAAEIRRLFHALVIIPLRALTTTALRAALHAEHWSDWRRDHQSRARRSHYQRRLTTELST